MVSVLVGWLLDAFSFFNPTGLASPVIEVHEA